MAKTRIYRFDKEGNLISTKTLREPEVKIRREGGAFKYSVSRGGKIIHAGIVGDLDDCAYCHKKIVGRAKRLGSLVFHFECWFLMDS